MIEELDMAEAGAEPTLKRGYTWGLDLSGTIGGGGGTGGLVLIHKMGSGTDNGTYFVGYDGNGNVSNLLNANAGSNWGKLEAVYEYSPFGETLRAAKVEGESATDIYLYNKFRFSTQYLDIYGGQYPKQLDTGQYYYGKRYYNPDTGRFINRDPIGESGGRNLYAFCGNDPVNRWDVLGMKYNDYPYYCEIIGVDEWCDLHRFWMNGELISEYLICRRPDGYAAGSYIWEQQQNGNAGGGTADDTANGGSGSGDTASGSSNSNTQEKRNIPTENRTDCEKLVDSLVNDVNFWASGPIIGLGYIAGAVSTIRDDNMGPAPTGFHPTLIA